MVEWLRSCVRSCWTSIRDSGANACVLRHCAPDHATVPPCPSHAVTVLITSLPLAVVGAFCPPGRLRQGTTGHLHPGQRHLPDGRQQMADGKRRGGFARLAAVVKAERAKGGHVIFAHAGDTLSPSLMSGLDRGAHIVTLHQHGRARHFRAGQSRIRFRQGDHSSSAWRRRKFPLYRRQPARADGTAAARLQGPRHRDGRRRAHRPHRRGA